MTTTVSTYVARAITPDLQFVVDAAEAIPKGLAPTVDAHRAWLIQRADGLRAAGEPGQAQLLVELAMALRGSDIGKPRYASLNISVVLSRFAGRYGPDRGELAQRGVQVPAGLTAGEPAPKRRRSPRGQAGAAPAPCACSPGSDANGWHEERSAACQKVESEQWAQAMALSRAIVDGFPRDREATLLATLEETAAALSKALDHTPSLVDGQAAADLDRCRLALKVAQRVAESLHSPVPTPEASS